MKVSRAAVRRFIYFVRGLEPAKYNVHQTLTCSSKVLDAHVAKKMLKRLLDNLSKQFQMAAIYVMETQGSGSWHFHVIFLFYPENALPCAPSRLTIDFRKKVLKAWQGLQTKKISPKGNETHQYDTFTLNYLLKALELAKPGEKLPRARFNWWGAWNQELLARHAQPLNKEAAKTDFPGWKPKPKRSRAANRKPTPPKQPYGRPQMEKQKQEFRAWLDATGSGPDWETYKRTETGRDKKVSDADFILFRNGRAPWIKRRKAKKNLWPGDDLPF